MRFIIIGNGKVGFSLAEQLIKENHDITMVDQDEANLARATETLDLMGIRGNGVSPETLSLAGAKDADMIIAVTNLDEVNMVCCRMAKNLGAGTTVARIRNPEYATAHHMLRRDMGIDIIINPEFATAVELSRLLRFPSATDIDTFCRGRVELMGFRLQEGDFLVGSPLSALPAQIKKLSLLFCVAEREGKAMIPNGNFIPHAEDKLYLIGRPSGLDQFFRHLGRYTPKVRSAFILGGGRISLYLAQILSKMRLSITIIEKDPLRCRALSEALPKCTIICGDGTEQELLESEGAKGNDAFIALTNRDEDNLMVALYAMQEGVSKVIAKCTRQNYATIVRSLGLESIISPKSITTDQILQVVRGREIRKAT